ncbi:hypothetical protein DAKH74_046340 [Maudiozyma humilis]|uniref:chitin synthase n=1 Tax=Maudiozyma humilis TaxID=51915 RepID=A0AAV5S581_MAUHU|nr:hypothetical protein DAKH74_046340 [Kazachstania humilis]
MTHSTDSESLNRSPSRRRLSSLSRHVTFWSAKSDLDAKEAQESLEVSHNPPRRYILSHRAHPLSAWKVYCFAITWWAPRRLMRLCGMQTSERQVAWREKVGLMSVIVYAGAFVTYLTFGLSGSLCNYSQRRVLNSDVSRDHVVVHGRAFDYLAWPDTSYIDVAEDCLFGPAQFGGSDASFVFQNVNGNCRDFIRPRENSTIPVDAASGDLAWYFPCVTLPAGNSSAASSFALADCHLDSASRSQFYALQEYSDVYYTWDQVRASQSIDDMHRLVVFNGDVLDLNLLDWLLDSDLQLSPYLEELRRADLQGYDISVLMNTSSERQLGKCLAEIIKVGEIDSKTVGCIAADAVLYVALGLILAIIVSKFLVAWYFHWAIAKKQGATRLDNRSMQEHSRAIEDWSRDIGTQAPPAYYPAVKPTSRKMLASYLEDKVNNFTSRRTLSLNDHSSVDRGRYAASNADIGGELTTMPIQAAHQKEMCFNDSKLDDETLDVSIVSPGTIQQPSPYYKPFNFPLIHTLCLVTCYSEDTTGLRTTLDSLATTDYPNSHKLLLVICDGLIKGSGNSMTTPDIVLGMVSDFAKPRDQVKACSYVAVTSGAKRHNMAKVYAGFYKYDPETVPTNNQQRVPMVVIVKCGTEEESPSPKAGNRGKRDSQIILMSFLQKITLNERMTELDYNILRGIWSVTGLMADQYEAVLMVDADTKVFPDSLTHMVSELVRSPEIMGLCGETKIANKRESFITAIQVFEYYISHHQIKAFESFFGTVTCLPGCFSIYRIKCPRGAYGEWVPILANPDICELYADIDIVTLHKKNLLLLGEDRYLTSLMLKTFPKRKLIFVPKAACKTVVPSSFKVLLSQRRRWINSTVHNLFELVLVPGLCGTFCFSMQFVVVIELIGTLVLPLAICFTLYVIGVAIFSPVMPTMTLILLAIILGLPGVLVLAIVSSFTYIGWLIVYLLALPLWNLVLPLYAFWKFDDFSWGDTRKVAGDNGGHEHDADNQNFEHSMIKMMTWRQFKYSGY